MGKSIQFYTRQHCTDVLWFSLLPYSVEQWWKKNPKITLSSLCTNLRRQGMSSKPWYRRNKRKQRTQFTGWLEWNAYETNLSVTIINFLVNQFVRQSVLVPQMSALFPRSVVGSGGHEASPQRDPCVKDVIRKLQPLRAGAAFSFLNPTLLAVISQDQVSGIYALRCTEHVHGRICSDWAVKLSLKINIVSGPHMVRTPAWRPSLRIWNLYSVTDVSSDSG